MDHQRPTLKTTIQPTNKNRWIWVWRDLGWYTGHEQKKTKQRNNNTWVFFLKKKSINLSTNTYVCIKYTIHIYIYICIYILYTYIWVNHNGSLTWNLQPFGVDSTNPILPSLTIPNLSVTTSGHIIPHNIIIYIYIDNNNNKNTNNNNNENKQLSNK